MFCNIFSALYVAHLFHKRKGNAVALGCFASSKFSFA